jgi:hypothetical protein
MLSTLSILGQRNIDWGKRTHTKSFIKLYAGQVKKVKFALEQAMKAQKGLALLFP